VDDLFFFVRPDGAGDLFVDEVVLYDAGEAQTNSIVQGDAAPAKRR
jgi:hypothetical protein